VRLRAIADAHVELADARAELEALRREVREARRRQPEPSRDRRLGAATDRARRAEEELGRLDAPPVQVAPLAVGDPVVAPEVGVRGTIVEIAGDEAEVAGVGGQRVRIALARLRPSAARAEQETRAPVSVRATTTPADLRDELDVRGRTAQEAREAVRSLVDDAALGGLRSVRVVHGRGTGALRTAVRDELRKHPLVHEIASEASDGATAARLAD
jgi:DNA mismatch repair protein MutS2